MHSESVFNIAVLTNERICRTMFKLDVSLWCYLSQIVGDCSKCNCVHYPSKFSSLKNIKGRPALT